jgi:glycosyltransferase-like protein LARGE
MLEGQCDVWSGVISAAVYIALVDGRAVTLELNSNQDPSLTPMDAVRAEFDAFHRLAEAKGLCKLDLQLVSQDVESVWLSALYPVNAMRNRAIANARTDVILLLDVDFWPSAELSALMAQPGKYESLAAAVSAGSAVVLPAYETGDSGEVGVGVAREAVLGGKDAGVVMFWDGRIKPFHTDRYKAGHRATDFRKWLAAARPYRIRYEEGFEPYVLVARKFVPWTDERFVGYRKNKVVHLLHLANLGLQFVVHPRAFVVHSPHPRARTWKVTHKTGLWDQLAELYAEVKSGLEANTYTPASMYSCGAHVVGPILPQVNHISEIKAELAA